MCAFCCCRDDENIGFSVGVSISVLQHPGEKAITQYHKGYIYFGDVVVWETEEYENPDFDVELLARSKLADAIEGIFK